MKQFIAFAFILICFACTDKRIQNSGTQNTINTSKGIAVMAYNIHHANPPSKEGFIDIEAIAKVIKDSKADLVALQEVDVFTERSGKNVHQAEAIAKLTGMHYYFGKAIDYGGGEYGVAILSRFPLRNMKTYPLPTAEGTRGEPRVVATVEVSLPGNKNIIFASTHLDAQRNDTNRLLQIKRINEIFKKETTPVVIGGDFNADPMKETIRILDSHFTRTCKLNCGFTIPVINPTKTIDFIAYSPSSAFIVKEHKVINEQYASDHLPVFSVLEVQ